MKQEVEWVDFRKKKPSKEGKYIIYAPSADPKSPFIYMAWYHPQYKMWSLIPEVWANAITHWMPLPKPPKEN